MPILGWIAVSQIRRSAGKLYGMWLAVFDGLIFPLLALDGLIIWVCLTLARMYVRPLEQGMAGKIPFHPGLFPGFAYYLHRHQEISIFAAIAIALAVDFLIIRRVWRALNQPLNDGANVLPPPPVRRTTRLTRKTVWILCTVYLVILSINLFQWWSKYESFGVWIPSDLDASVSGEYGEALIHVTEVSQSGQVVLVKFVCDTPYPERGLYVQYSGQIFDYPADTVSTVTNVDCLVSPRFNSGEDKVLAGTTLLKGKPSYQIGFILPDAATAAKVVKQVKQVHLGKPRGLGQKNSSLNLFSLYRNVGKKPGGEPVTEGLDAMLNWQPKQNPNANTKPGSCPSRLSLEPFQFPIKLP